MENKYKLHDVVEHKKGGVYVIVQLPDYTDLLEHSGEPYYKYVSTKNPGIKWNRKKSEMESSRFKITLDEISENSLKQIYSSIKNFDKIGIDNKPIDFDELRKYVDDDEEVDSNNRYFFFHYSIISDGKLQNKGAVGAKQPTFPSEDMVINHIKKTNPYQHDEILIDNFFEFKSKDDYESFRGR